MASDFRHAFFIPLVGGVISALIPGETAAIYMYMRKIFELSRPTAFLKSTDAPKEKVGLYVCMRLYLVVSAYLYRISSKNSVQIN